MIPEPNPFSFCVTERAVLGKLARTTWGAPDRATQFAEERLKEIRESDAAREKADEIIKELAGLSRPKKPQPPEPQGAVIELVELGRNSNPQGVMKPNTLRINGVQVLVPTEDAIEIENLDEPGRMDALIVRVRMYARQVIIGEPL